MPETISEDEKRWRAESDAIALARAEEIKGDGERMAMAAAKAEVMANEQELYASEQSKRAKALHKIAKANKPKENQPPAVSSKVKTESKQIQPAPPKANSVVTSVSFKNPAQKYLDKPVRTIAKN